MRWDLDLILNNYGDENRILCWFQYDLLAMLDTQVVHLVIIDSDKGFMAKLNDNPIYW